MASDRTGRSTSIALRAQAFALQEEGIPVARIKEVTGLAISTIYRIKKIAFERGYDPKVSRELKDEYFADAPRSGRPKVITEESAAKVLELVHKDREGREKPVKELGFYTGMSETSALWVLHSAGLWKWKPTWKPGLTAAMREARYQFCLRHKDWSMEDWKNVI
jgi:hypothetical protein